VASHSSGTEPAPAAPPTNIPQEPAEHTSSTESGVPNVSSPTPEPNATPGRTDPNKPFRVDSAGKLILDEQTRLNMEALFAQTDRGDLLEAQQEITRQLPPAAAAEAAVLLEQYDNYSKAQRQTYPPGVAPATDEAALAELEGLHALRVAHFGPEAAKAFYGAEEAIARSLIDLMRLEKDQSLTMEEKAARAQQLYDRRPELN
jgi:lipase chaperone LimK